MIGQNMDLDMKNLSLSDPNVGNPTIKDSVEGNPVIKETKVNIPESQIIIRRFNNDKVQNIFYYGAQTTLSFDIATPRERVFSKESWLSAFAEGKRQKSNFITIKWGTLESITTDIQGFDLERLLSIKPVDLNNVVS